MTCNSRVSVAMATYNGAQYLREQLDSLASQTRLPDELVVTDDGSTDSTLEVLADFAKSAPFPVRIERNPNNLGYAKNFEKAARLCTGDIVFFCDQDDIWHAQKIETVVARFKESCRALTVLNDARLVDETGRWSGKTQYGSIRKVGLGDRLFVTGCCSAHRRAWLELILPIPDGMAHDLWVSRAAHELGGASIIDRPLQDFRRHGANSSDWLISRPDQGAGVALQFHMQSGLKPADAGWRFEQEMLRDMKARLEKAPSGLLSSLGLEKGPSALDRNIATFQRRIDLCARPRRKRIFPVLQLLAHGGYGQFSGWKSALKDLVRP